MKDLLERSKLLKRPSSSQRNLLEKIIYMSNLIVVSRGDVLFHGKSTLLSLMLLVACLIHQKRLYVISDLNIAKNTLRTSGIGTVFLQGASDKSELYDTFGKYSTHFGQANGIFILYEGNILYRQNIEDCVDALVYQEEYRSDYESAMTVETYRLYNKKLDHIRNSLRQDQNDTPALSLYKHSKEYTYSRGNIGSMMGTLHDEFHKEEQYEIDFSKLDFLTGFAYILYFFLKGDIIYTTQTFGHSTMKQLVFMSEEALNRDYHKRIKTYLLSKWNAFFANYKLTKWIRSWNLRRYLKKYYDLAKKDEIYVIGKLRNYYLIKYLPKTRLRFSTIFGTQADGYTVGINKYNDKETQLIYDEYRIMDHKNMLKFGVNTLEQLCIGGARVANNVKNFYPAFSKTKTKYYNTEIYCEIEKDIIEVLGDKEDIYFTEDISFTLFSHRKVLQSLPYLKDAMILKHNEKFIAVVEVDVEYVEENFEVPNRSNVVTTLTRTIVDINHGLDRKDSIQKVVVSKEFFRVLKDSQEFVETKDFIKLLNQQPFYFKEDLQG